jgi:signal transduction histidine kinase
MWFTFITVQSGAWLVAAIVCYAYSKRKSSPTLAMFARIWLFVGITEMATLPLVQHPYPQYGGVIVLVTVLSGLLISGWYVPAFTLMACLVPLSQSESPDWSWTVYAGWCVVYVTAGWIVRMFTKHLERFFEASRVAEEQQRSAIVAERVRFARDMHDTLAQGFTGIMMQLNAAEQRLQEDSGQARSHIDKARQLANDSLEEARRSVSALRSAALSNGTLLDAIAQIGQKLTSDSSVQLETTLEGQPYSLTESCEANLLRIAQEAMTNAVRHASASSIEVRLAYLTGSVVLEVGDRGRGMSGGESSGFGLDGMRQRAREIGGEIRILSDPGRGTRILVTVPNA